MISESLIDDICEINIGNSYRSDHSPVILTLKINEFIKGRGLWKFNNSLLQDPEYVKLIKQQIANTVEQYKMPVHRGVALHSIDNLDIDFSINDQLLLETLLLEIRGKTISYSTFIKRERTKQEIQLTEEIQNLENEVSTEDTLDEIEAKKCQLRILRQNKVKGQYVRSRTQWIEEGERPTIFFCNLETQNFVNKTIKKLVTDENTVVENQKEILKQSKIFYEKLYKRQGCLKKVNLSKELPSLTSKLNDIEKDSLEGNISFAELTQALKRMKNNKSPGSDGFTAEFFKVFWIDIGKFVLRLINYSYQIGEMSVTQRQGVITCIPKEGKSKQFLKNWRTITLLNSTYKLASSCIAERIKSVLNRIIDSDQTGFIPGRFIGENCKLIYDILQFTEENDIPGILLLIDFEKAFDYIMGLSF